MNFTAILLVDFPNEVEEQDNGHNGYDHANTNREQEIEVYHSVIICIILFH